MGKGWVLQANPPRSVLVGFAGGLTRVGIVSFKGESYRLLRANTSPTVITKVGIMCPFVKLPFVTRYEFYHNKTFQENLMSTALSVHNFWHPPTASGGYKTLSQRVPLPKQLITQIFTL